MNRSFTLLFMAVLNMELHTAHHELHTMHPTDALLTAWIGQSTPGAAYVHFDRSRIVHERYAGMADLDTRRAVDAHTGFHGFSVTKTMTALAVVQLARSGELDLDDLVREHLPTMPYSGDIRVRHLLTHTAGLPNPLPLSWVHAPDETFDRDAFFAGVFARHPRTRFVPGERSAYSNLGYVLLGQLIERITGVRYEQHIAAAILRPAGIAPGELGFELPSQQVHATGYLQSPSLLSFVLPFMLDTKWLLGKRTGRWRAFQPFVLNGAPYGGSLGTVTGYRKYLQALLTDGLLLERAWCERLFTENTTTSGKHAGMAMGWFTGTLRGRHYVAHAGGGGGYYAEIRVYPEVGRGSVVLLNRTGIKDERLLDQLDAALLGE